MARNRVQNASRLARSSLRCGKALPLPHVTSTPVLDVPPRAITRGREALEVSARSSPQANTPPPAAVKVDSTLSRKRPRQAIRVDLLSLESTQADDTSLEDKFSHKRRKYTPSSGRTRLRGESPSSAIDSQIPENPATKRVASTARTGRGRAKPSQDGPRSLSDNENPDHASTESSAASSDVPSTKSFPKPEISPLIQEQERQKRQAACGARKSEARSESSQRQKTKDQLSQKDQDSLVATESVKEAEKAKKATEAPAKRETARTKKMSEIQVLVEKGAQEPTPWTLKCPNLPPRQNTSGRNLPLKLSAGDPTFPLTDETRNEFTTTLMDALRDSRSAEDQVSITTNFWHMWLKPGVHGKYSYDELDMERVCRKLINIAEGLHSHGLGTTDIYCPMTIEKATASRPMTFRKRIEKLALLMRKSKSRCNDFMLGNTLEDTIALIDTKLSDQKSNAANNQMRSRKNERSNKVLGIAKGEKRPKNKRDEPPMLTKAPASGYQTPESMARGIADFERNDPAEDNVLQYARGLRQPIIANQDGTQYHRGRQDQAFSHHIPVNVGVLHLDSTSDFTSMSSQVSVNSVFEGLHGYDPQLDVLSRNSQQYSAAPRSCAPIHQFGLEPANSGLPDRGFMDGSTSVHNPGTEETKDSRVFASPVTMHQDAVYDHEMDPNLAFTDWSSMLQEYHNYTVYDPVLRTK